MCDRPRIELGAPARPRAALQCPSLDHRRTQTCPTYSDHSTIAASPPPACASADSMSYAGNSCRAEDSPMASENERTKNTRAKQTPTTAQDAQAKDTMRSFGDCRRPCGSWLCGGDVPTWSSSISTMTSPRVCASCILFALIAAICAAISAAALALALFSAAASALAVASALSSASALASACSAASATDCFMAAASSGTLPGPACAPKARGSCGSWVQPIHIKRRPAKFLSGEHHA
mmetsp:Transcript_26366/g.52729  ORF Transcript_26366/g.52729 Transcript_26366/m.52729 type:complete len:236 (+) Transcript_26366:281-988(+)